MTRTNSAPHVFKTFSVQEFLENGNAQWYVVAPDAAVIVPVTDDGKVVLIREYRQNTGKMHWYLPAGRKKDVNEDPADCARRELREETGFDATHIEHMFTTESKAKWYKQKKSFYVSWGLFESPLDTGDEIKAPEVHLMTMPEVVMLLDHRDENGYREIDDDIGDALGFFVRNFGLKKYEFHDNIAHVLQQTRVESSGKSSAFENRM